MAHDYKTRRRVEFAETDAAGIVHFSVYFRYMEEAEHAFLRSLGLTVRDPLETGEVIGFPRVSARCEYSRAVRFEDEVDIHVWLSRKGNSTLEYSFVLSHDSQEVARGQMVAVACRVVEGRSITRIQLPEVFDRALEQAPYPPLEFYSQRQGGSGE